MTNGFDLAAAQWFYSIRCDFLNVIFTTLTHLGDAWFITGLCIILILLPYARSNHYTWPLVTAAIIPALLQLLIKEIVKRPRPDMDMFLIHQSGYSFPSGHATTGMVFYGFAIYLINRKFPGRKWARISSLCLGCLIFLLGFSRLYCGVHYVTDVMAGWAIGGVVLFILIKIHRRYGEN